MPRNQNILIVFITTITLLISCDRKREIILSENEIRRYEDSAASFIKWLIKNDSGTLFMRILNENNPNTIKYHKVLSSNLTEYSRPLKILSSYKIIKDSIYFSPIDTNFIYEIIKNKINNNIIDTNIHLIGFTLLNENLIEKKHKELNSYSKISIPIFNSDYNLVVIEINKLCYPECGYGIECVYQRSSNGWKKIKQIDTWVN